MRFVYTYNGKQFETPVEDLTIKLDFQANGIDLVQPILTDVSSITMTHDSAKEVIRQVQTDGAFNQFDFEGYFEDNGVRTDIIKGYLDDFEYDFDKNRVIGQFNNYENIGNLQERLSVLSAILYKDSYKYQDLNYIIEKTPEELKSDLLLLSLSTLTYSYILYSQIKNINDYIATLSEASLSSISVKIIEGISLALFVGTTVVSLVKNVIELKELLLPRIRKTKVISLREILTKPLEDLGYKLVTNISDIDNVYFWASHSAVKDTYIPSYKDVCYEAVNAFELAFKKYNARFKVIDNKVYMYPENDNFWKKSAIHELDDISLNNYKLNTNEMISSRSINYAVDTMDDYTYEDFKGAQYLVTCNIADKKKSNVKNYQSTDYGCALTSRKTQLNEVEVAWEEFVKIFNKVAEIFGSKKENGILKSRIGVAKISQEAFSVGKLVYLVRGKIPANHRDLLSAKTDEEKWHYSKSFVRNKDNLRSIYTGKKINFNLRNFKEVLQSGYFKTKDGRNGKFISLEWDKDNDFAIASFWIENKYNTKLIEEFYESTK